MVCPFIDSDHAHCAEHLKLDKIDYAVAVCGNDFTVCPAFWDQMNRVRNDSDAAHKSVA
jgi:hypothetical protein